MSREVSSLGPGSDSIVINVNVSFAPRLWWWFVFFSITTTTTTRPGLRRSQVDGLTGFTMIQKRGCPLLCNQLEESFIGRLAQDIQTFDTNVQFVFDLANGIFHGVTFGQDTPGNGKKEEGCVILLVYCARMRTPRTR